MLDQLFSATMQKPNVRVATLNNLTIELKHETQYTMGCRVLRTKVNIKVANALFARLDVFKSSVSHLLRDLLFLITRQNVLSTLQRGHEIELAVFLN